jgi:hypothetical protein
MRPDFLRRRTRWVDPWVVTAAEVWLLVLLVVCVRAVFWPRVHSLYPTYAAAGGDWLAGASTYYHGERPAYFDQYRYSPLVSALLVPFHLLPERAGGVLWRLLNAAVFLGGVGWWARSAVPLALAARHQAALFLLAVPLSLSSLGNGQPNALMIGLLLIAVVGAVRGRWWLAAGCVALATALKIYPLAVGLLLAAVYPRRFGIRLAVALALVAGLPFLLQRPEYVAGQYAEWMRLLGDDDRKLWPLDATYRDLWLLLRVWRVPISPKVYVAVQLAAAVGCAALCVAARRRGWEARRVLTTCLVLGTVWMTLCGPATESCTYILLAPVLAYGLVAAVIDRWPLAVRALFGGSFVLFLLSVLAGLFPRTGQVHALGLQPLAALLLGVGYVAVTLRALAAPHVASGADEYPTPSRAA